MKINLHIERLILDGLPVAHGPSVAQLRAGLEAELSRLLAAGELAQLRGGGGAVPRLPSPSMKFSPAAKPARLGEQIAQAVHGAMKK